MEASQSGYFFECCQRWFPEPRYHYCLKTRAMELPEPKPMAQVYRKKPVKVEAMRFDGQNALAIVAWMHPEIQDPFLVDGGLYIATLEGAMRADPGDYVIKGTEGEFYPCKPGIFAKTYEAV